MEIFQQSIVQIEPSDFNPEAHEQIWQLDLSSDFQSILETIRNNKDTSRVYYIHGEPGSGCSTLLQGLCQQLCNTNVVKESEILFLSLNEGCRKALFWEFMSKLAKKKNDAEKVSLFSKSSVNKDLKKEGLVEFFEDHFKVICIDNGDLCLKFIDSFLGEVLKTCKITSVLVIASQTDNDRPSDDVLSNVTVNGLCDSAARNLFSTELQQLTLKDDELSNLCDLVNCNPVAIQLVCAFLNNQEENDSLSVLEWTDTAGQKSCVLEMVLRLTNKHLKASSTGILCELCFLQQPLPLLNMPPVLEELIKLKLLRVQNKEEIQCIHLPSTLKKYLKCQKDLYSEPDIEFDVLHHWLSLVSNQKLHSLIKEAEEHAWPFVPESWQFIDDKDVGKNESFNVKEHIISKNVHMPSLTELQILHECLYHAYLQKNFKKLAAVTFVLDRFLFWQGDKKISMAIVDYIQEHSPETAIAPQLLVRRARNMKNEGNLRGAEEILDEVSKEKEGVGHWKHRHEFQADLTRAACIQLKGEIQYILGNWLKSAGLLLESIELFANLPNPDKKGLSLGYGLLCPCLRNMTSRDYSILAQKFGLVQLHPLLAAYISAQEAAKSSTYTPMFFVRHVCHAGEVLLEFIKLSTHKEERQMLLRVAIEDLKDSIQAHQSFKSLTSREQFYILVLACFKLSLALLERQSENDKDVGRSLKPIAAKLFEHYCSSTGHVLVDDRVVELIKKCLDLLRLETYHNDNLPDSGQILLKYYKRRGAQRLEENTRLRVEGLFANNKQMPSMPGSPESLTYDESSLFGSPGNNNQHISRNDVEKYPVIETISERLTDESVDRCAVTIEDKGASDKDRDSPPENGIDVDQEFESKPGEDTGRSEKDGTVDRCARTVEEEKTLSGMNENQLVLAVEEKVEFRAGEDTGTPEKDGTVDRRALTVEEEEKLVVMTEDKRTAALRGEDLQSRTGEDMDRPESRVTVDQFALTMGEVGREVSFKTGITVDDHKVGEEEVGDLKFRTDEDTGRREGGVPLDQYAGQVEGEQKEASDEDGGALTGEEKEESKTSGIGEVTVIPGKTRCRTDQEVARSENDPQQIEGRKNIFTEECKPREFEVLEEDRNNISDTNIDQIELIMNTKGEEEKDCPVDDSSIQRDVKSTESENDEKNQGSRRENNPPIAPFEENEGNKNIASPVDDSKYGKVSSRCSSSKDEKPKSLSIQGKILDRDAFAEDQLKSKTVDEYAFLLSRSAESDSQIIIQSLEDEAVSLPSHSQPKMPLHFGELNPQQDEDKSKRALDGILWKYDFPSRQWRYNQIMVYIGDPLELQKGMEGAQRDVYAVEFINQDEPLQRYVAKRYRKKIHHQQYENDVLSQMTARHYVAMFNQELSKAAAGVTVGEIQFLPVVLLQLVNTSGHVTDVLNAEPYMSGEFTKLTNNVDWKNERRRTDLVLAYSHFTYQASDCKLIIVDIQGWAPRDNKGCTFLTDPQIHSRVYKCFGTGNHGIKGFEKFWTELHSECNHICRMLNLRRPSAL